jgi:hypothetical protein
MMRSLWSALGELLQNHLNEPEEARRCFDLAERRAFST